MLEIRTASADDIDRLHSLTSDESHVKDNDYFRRCLDEQASGLREVLLVLKDGALAGYCFYQRKPRYQPFRSLGIPEIQDLYIHPRRRRAGLASALIESCCAKAKEEGADMIGIGVAVNRDYGKAQKLYFKTGFEPDGAGLVYEREAVTPGQSCRADDELCLMLVKPLR